METEHRFMSSGLAPASPQFLTAQAQSALDSKPRCCAAIRSIWTLSAPISRKKNITATGMTQEIDRCRWALETAQRGKAVALVCSGDAGVYGMASPLLELAEAYPDVAVEVVPGLTAALSGGAVLGAPLAHDFCVISLSDRLTPWEVIEKRLAGAAMGDFCVALYNPSSKGRPDYLAKGRAHPAGKRQSRRRPSAGWCATSAARARPHRVLTLAQLESTPVDMFTTVYIGNAATPSSWAEDGHAAGVPQYEGSGVQRHHRGPGVLPAAGRSWARKFSSA